MAKRDPDVALRHMLEHGREALDLTGGMTKERFLKDRVVQLATVRLLEVLGEAANRVPPTVQLDHPTIPWPRIVALRNRLIHAYDAVDMTVVWRVLKDDRPPVVDELERALRRKR